MATVSLMALRLRAGGWIVPRLFRKWLFRRSFQYHNPALHRQKSLMHWRCFHLPGLQAESGVRFCHHIFPLLCFRPYLRCKRSVLPEDFPQDITDRIKKSTRIIAEIHDHFLHSLFLQVIKSFLILFAGNACKLCNADVTDFRIQHFMENRR